MDLIGKVAIVTGASAGIGRAYALALAAAGATVVAAARRLGSGDDEPPGGNSLAALIRAGTGLPGRIYAHVCDMESALGVEELVRHAGVKFGRIDVLVNNAAMLGRLKTADITSDIFDRYMATNVRGPFLAIREAAVFMKRQGSGSIINISAAVGNMTPTTNFPDYLVYAVSKAGLNRLSYYLAAELKPFNIAVNALSPGVVASESAIRTDSSAARSDRFKPATPEVLGPALVYLARQTAETLTAQWLHTDEFGKTWGA